MLLQTQGNLIAAMVSPHPSQSHWVFCCNSIEKQNKTNKLEEAGKPVFLHLITLPMSIWSLELTWDLAEKQNSTALGTESLYEERRSLPPEASI